MNILKKNSSPRYKRDNITSHLLVSALTCGAENLAITLVEMEPGGVQHIHSHKPEQMYYILEGSGVMSVDGEQRQVQAGDCIYYPPFAKHGLENTGGTVLRYLSAASPSFTAEACKRLWPLPSLDEESL
ncbi:MAG: cupin domain-containing protein [Anaerolineae bacterium]|jgi:mannose-6-phosphate isomerase-like protein (cupin superfamily)